MKTTTRSPIKNLRRTFAAALATLAVLAILAPASSWAQPKGGPGIRALCLPAHDAPKPKGCWRGFWFPKDAGVRLLKLDDDHQRLVIEHKFVERKLELRRGQLTSRTAEADALRSQLTQAHADARREKQRADELSGRFSEAWRSPYVWLAVGLVVGGGTVAIVATR